MSFNSLCFELCSVRILSNFSELLYLGLHFSTLNYLLDKLNKFALEVNLGSFDINCLVGNQTAGVYFLVTIHKFPCIIFC